MSCLEATIKPDSTTHIHINGTNLFLTCECSDASSTLPTLWYHDDRLVRSGDTVRFVGHHRKLILVPALLNDSGNYSCSIGNATSKKINVVVIGKVLYVYLSTFVMKLWRRTSEA